MSKHTIRPQDEALFSAMEGNCQSAAEANFFKNMRYKQESEPTLANDLLVSEFENDDHIYLVRCEYEEYIVGHGIDEEGQQEEHVMTLAEALSVKLANVGLVGRDITLHQWLRERDYKGVMYDRDYDLM